MGVLTDNDTSTCLCGAAEADAYLDGGTRVCKNGHVYHICVDSIKKYGFIKKCFTQNIPCGILPITFEK